MLSFYLEVYIYSNYIGSRPTHGGYDSGLSTLANYLSTARYSGYLYPDFSSYTFGWKPIGGHYSFGGYNGFWGSGGLWGVPNFNWWQGPVGFNYYYGINPWGYYPYPTLYHTPNYTSRTPSYSPHYNSAPNITSPIRTGPAEEPEVAPPQPETLLPRPPAERPTGSPAPGKQTKDVTVTDSKPAPPIVDAKTPAPPPPPAASAVSSFGTKVTLDQVNFVRDWPKDVAKSIADQITEQAEFKKNGAGKTIEELSVGVTVPKGTNITALRYNKSAIQARVAELLKKGNTTIKEMRLNFKEQEVATKPAVPPPSPKAAAPEVAPKVAPKKAAKAHPPAEKPLLMHKLPPPPPTIASIPSFSTAEPASKSEPAGHPAPEPIISTATSTAIPDWQRPYNVKDLNQKVVATIDFNLPSDVKEEFDGWLKKQRATNSEQLVEAIAKWARKYTSSWGSDYGAEFLSVTEICKKRAGKCSELTSSLYALMMHAKGNPVHKKQNLDDVEFGFAQIADGAWTTNHVCLTAKINGEIKFCDIAGGAVIRNYNKPIHINRKEYIATLLCNKGAEVQDDMDSKWRKLTTFGKKDPDPTLLTLYDKAVRLGENNAVVLMRAATTYYNIATEYSNYEKWEKAKEYAQKADRLLDRFKQFPKPSGYEYINKNKDILEGYLHPLLAQAVRQGNKGIF